MRTWRKAALLIIGVAALSGCQSTVRDKSPQEMLSLTVAGLAAVDRYTFTGTTSIYGADMGAAQPITFQGSVEDHKRIQVKSNKDNEDIQITRQPFNLLKHIEATAATTELVAANSGERTAVLRIVPDKAASRRTWIKKQNEAFERLVKDDELADGAGRKLSLKAGNRMSYEQERADEISRSRKQLAEMLNTLNVDTTYQLIIDRKRLLPLKLHEHTVLQYKADGKNQREERKSELIFITE
ncbi:hypothetical protein [Paenibacillus spongiae]|uniref:DUF3221 domain-containing protein n=1 Tax=Paenibacillus spongiae TaxID=2909671 RepID=A0ABY5S1W6_9BACL|nr:hypothetical protein [Paenibacillus spongiae]UVI27862.1 hypothetical protein L1F29_20650 [Paenibacillus spongiae]